MNTRLYNLATDYQSFLNSHTTTPRQHLTQLHVNIFDKESSKKQKPYDLFTAKNYDIVGLKELKEYENKIKKDKKNTYRKDTYFREQSPRENVEMFLTKKEVIDSLPQINHNESLLKNKDKFKTQKSDLAIESGNYSPKIEDFSVSRIKAAFAERKAQWNQIQNKSDKKYPSVLKTVDKFRQKVELKIRDSKQQELDKLNSLKWTGILRNDLSLRDMAHKKPFVHTFQGENFTTRGLSKRKCQQEWLEKKYEQGYHFKKIKISKVVICQKK